MAASDKTANDSLYPIAVLIDELKNEDVQAGLTKIHEDTVAEVVKRYKAPEERDCLKAAYLTCVSSATNGHMTHTIFPLAQLSLPDLQPDHSGGTHPIFVVGFLDLDTS
ncbi:uncharacterized protein LOC142223544 [Haematobia irritans]|uniref:uncharacterized protein LOC142223544 n=1 Tax=Haematobia irritans TaxID=7368 RepID=UPI003F4F46BB